MTPVSTLRELPCQSCSTCCLEVTTDCDRYQIMQSGRWRKQRQPKIQGNHSYHQPQWQVVPMLLTMILTVWHFLGKNRGYFVTALGLQLLPVFTSLLSAVQTLLQLRLEPSKILWSKSSQLHTWDFNKGDRGTTNNSGQCEHLAVLLLPRNYNMQIESWNRIPESLRLESPPILPSSTINPELPGPPLNHVPKVLHPHTFWTLPGMVTPALPWRK